jgi:membrane protein DedA with SNARE-associated domain
LPAVLALGWAGMVAGTSLDYVLGRWGLHSVLQRTGMMARLAPRLAEAELRIRSRSNW